MELMAEELEKLEDRLDAQDAREALAEPGGITHEELVEKLGLWMAYRLIYVPKAEREVARLPRQVVPRLLEEALRSALAGGRFDPDLLRKTAAAFGTREVRNAVERAVTAATPP